MDELPTPLASNIMQVARDKQMLTGMGRMVRHESIHTLNSKRAPNAKAAVTSKAADYLPQLKKERLKLSAATAAVHAAAHKEEHERERGRVAAQKGKSASREKTEARKKAREQEEAKRKKADAMRKKADAQGRKKNRGRVQRMTRRIATMDQMRTRARGDRFAQVRAGECSDSDSDL